MTVTAHLFIKRHATLMFSIHVAIVEKEVFGYVQYTMK